MEDEDDEEARDEDENVNDEDDEDGCENDDGTAIVASLLVPPLPRRCG